MLGLLPLAVHLFGRSLTTTPGAFLDNVGPRLSAYEHTITATGGFESCALTFPAIDLEEALTWAERLLCPVRCYGPDADLIWDGFVAGVELRVGSRVRSYSLDAVQNRVRTRYTTALGTAGTTATASNTTSQALYGVRDGVVSVGALDLAGANALRDAWLARYALPRAIPQTSIATGAGSGVVDVVLTCAGWYTTLDWVLLERTDTATEAATAQVATLISGSSPGIGATNAFLATSLATGSSTAGVVTTRKIEADTTYRAAIEQRLGLGDTGGQRFAWGVFDASRALSVRTWAGATPTAITYRLRMGETAVQSGGGAGVDLWQVRPGAMVEDADFVAVGPPSGAVETPAAFYVERVAFRVDGSGMELVLEPEAMNSLDARVARVS